MPEGVWNSETSAARRLARPEETFPPALLNLGISAAATVFGSSPLFNLFNNVDVWTVPHPRLNAKLVNAPNWLSLRTTFLPIRPCRQLTNLDASDSSSCVAVSWLRGKEKGTSAQLALMHLCPNPAVGRPMGSGLGLGTKPSNCLMREMVAALGAVAPAAQLALAFVLALDAGGAAAAVD